jgi:hypothetical protein
LESVLVSEVVEVTVNVMPPADPDVEPTKFVGAPALTERLVVTAADADEVISPNMATAARAVKVR